VADFLRCSCGWTRLDRLDDGRVMCCLCFGFFTVDELHRLEDGSPVDVCVPCAEAEAALMASQGPADA
jgi:hypothetical protein